MKKLKLLFLVLLATTFSYAMEGKEMTIYKSPYCGCCTLWTDIMKKNGFKVNVVIVDNVMFKNEELGITPYTASCHTAIVDGYVVVGHVDYFAVKRMLTEKPNIKGITVPGMPIGSPGMEQGNIKQAYNILYINKDGTTGIYEKIEGN